MLQSLGRKFFVIHNINLFLRKVAPVHFIQVAFLEPVRVAGNPAIVAGLLEYGRESLDVLHISVVDFVVLGAEPEVQLIKKLSVDAGERKVGHMVFFFEEEPKLVLQILVPEHGLPAVALLLHKNLVVFDETVEQWHDVGRLAFSRSVEYRTLN